MEAPKKLIIDTDPGIDDALAILFALLNEAVDVELITLVQGNTHLQNTLRNLRAILTVAKRYCDYIKRPYHKPKVALGTGIRVDGKEPVYAHAFHGNDGLGNYFKLTTFTDHDDLNAQDIASAHVLPDDDILVMCQRTAEDEILKCISDNATDTITLVAVGPLSNVWRAIDHDPHTIAKLKALVIMGGTFDLPGNVSALAEFNFFADPLAAHLVIANCPCPVRLVPLDTTMVVGRLYKHDVEACYPKTAMSPITEFLKHILGHAFRVREKNAKINKNAVDDGELVLWTAVHDPLCIAAIVDESILSWKPLTFEVEPEGMFTKGMCVCDKRPFVLEGRAMSDGTGRDVCISSPDGSNSKFVALLLSTLFHIPMEAKSHIQNVTTIATECRESILVCTTVDQFKACFNQYTKDVFVSELYNLIEKRATLTPAQKARILIVLWENGLRDEVDTLLFDVTGFFSRSELFKLIPLLDNPRKARQIKKKIEKSQTMRPKKRSQLESTIKNLEAEAHGANLTESFARRVRKYVKSIPKEGLEFDAVNFPIDNWKVVADLCHLHKDDFAVPWFLPFVFGTPAPEGSAVTIYHSLRTENLHTLVMEHSFLAETFSTIRQRISEGFLTLTDAARVELTRKAPLEDVLWFYPEMVGHCSAADAVLETRLRSGEVLGFERGRLNYCKLMEIILSVEHKTSLKEALLIGDCSGSMEVAVKTATIIASVLTARLKNSELSFFNNKVVLPPMIPKTASDVLTVATAVRATNATSPAACLWPYLKKETHVDLFVMVTDEQENTACQGMMFAPMMAKYLAKVNPSAKIFFCSFLRANDQGHMVKQLRGIVEPKQFRLDLERPDLSKFDELLGLVSLMISDQNAANGQEMETVETHLEAMTLESESEWSIVG
ncbi:hypothetical protein SmJEL517_g00171 [Synchytrium microbalum]|uniref:Inosine/uridine-preferring nucleoside hydrolase domain-containing protein n=1 Tax=Synchytrium microbalum TaxID=1806994 RepID=A0A507CKI3_9FUNG|nr:uncharacterized protein SmJEL517_g00171 [Synchytrium microbalum]TPX38343.1 hypothetical protein SmJEL517_g00171 [Synchytrium microbalum]